MKTNPYIIYENRYIICQTNNNIPSKHRPLLKYPSNTLNDNKPNKHKYQPTHFNHSILMKRIPLPQHTQRTHASTTTNPTTADLWHCIPNKHTSSLQQTQPTHPQLQHTKQTHTSTTTCSTNRPQPQHTHLHPPPPASKRTPSLISPS